MNRHSLDDMIRKALEKVESEQRSADWDTFASKLESSQPDDIDSFVKDHLEKIQPTSSQAWNSFEDKFAEELGNEHPVDRTVKTNLAGHEAPYSESSWYRLSYLLDLTDRRERDLLIRKVSEILTVSLLLFILVPQLFIQNDKRTPPPPQQFAHTNQTEPLEKIDPSAGENWNVASEAKSNLTLDQFGNLVLPETESLSAEDESSTLAIRYLHTAVELPTEFLPQPEINGIITASGKDEADILIQRTSSSQSSLIDPALSRLPNYELRDMDAMQSIPLVAIREIEENEYLKSNIQLLNKPKRRNYRISTYFTPRLTHVYTPYDEVYDNESYGRLKVFRETGLELEKRNGNVTIGGSVGYGTMDYRPPVVVEAYGGNIAEVSSEEILGGYRSLSLSNINMSMLSASMFLRHFYPISQNLRWFSHFGGGINMVLSADYLVQDIIDHSDGTFTETEFTFNDAESSAATEHVRLRKKNFEGGILEGGNFNRNSFMDIELGAGLEFDLSPRSSIFLATVLNLSPFADGLGPNNDKVNSLDLKLGYRHWL